MATKDPAADAALKAVDRRAIEEPGKDPERDSVGDLTGNPLDPAPPEPLVSTDVRFSAAAPPRAALRQLGMQESPAFIVEGRALRIVESNRAAAAALGCPGRDMVGRRLSEMLDSHRSRARRGGARESGDHPPVLRLTAADGVVRAYSASLVPVRAGGRDLAVCVLHELTDWIRRDADLERRYEDLSRMARHDDLTGLFNRSMFGDTLALANARIDRSGRLMGVLYIDLDGFKPINDRFGHDVGDRLLVEVVHRLKTGLRSSDVMARLGGDEFGVILENLKRRDDALKVSRNLIGRLGEPFVVEAGRVRISASIGAVVTARPVEDAWSLVVQADRTMYEAKALGRGCAALAPVDSMAQQP